VSWTLKNREREEGKKALSKEGLDPFRIDLSDDDAKFSIDAQ